MYLENVRSKEEAKQANLQEKEKITGLAFIWNNREGSCNNNEEVLKGLQPHPNIQSIEIQNFSGENFLAWLLTMKVPIRTDNGDSFTLLNNLTELALDNCLNCERIPSLGNLPSLKYLFIDRLKKVKYIGNEFYGIDSGTGGWRLFLALKRFSLGMMRSLDEWRAPEGGGNNTVEELLFPCLEELRICYCRNLTKIPISNLPSLVILKTLEICDCSLTTLPSALPSFTSLEELSVSCCNCLVSISEDLLGRSTCLTSLEITFCRSLSYFPHYIIGSLTRLKKLAIGAFSKELDDLSYLNSVHNLTWE